jgi:hypothetical protein
MVTASVVIVRRRRQRRETIVAGMAMHSFLLADRQVSTPAAASISLGCLYHICPTAHAGAS